MNNVSGLFGHSDDWLNNKALEIETAIFGNPLSCADAKDKLARLEASINTDPDQRNQRAFQIIRPQLQAYLYQHCQNENVVTHDVTNPAPTPAVDPNYPDPTTPAPAPSGGMSKTLLYVALAIGAVWFITQKKRR
jgi:hypothetical protein